MSNTVRLWAAGLALAAVGGLLYLANPGSAGGAKGPAGDVAKIAEALKKGSKDDAEAHAKKVAKKLEELYEVMELFRPVKKGGYKVKGFKDTQGIESQLRVIARDAPSNFAKDQAEIEEMGLVTAAIAEITEEKAPAKDIGKKKRSDWLQWSKDMREAGLTLAKAKSAQEAKTAAAKVNASCNNCHSVYRQ